MQGKIWMIKSHAAGYKVITTENRVPPFPREKQRQRKRGREKDKRDALCKPTFPSWSPETLQFPNQAASTSQQSWYGLSYRI